MSTNRHGGPAFGPVTGVAVAVAPVLAVLAATAPAFAGFPGATLGLAEASAAVGAANGDTATALAVAAFSNPSLHRAAYANRIASPPEISAKERDHRTHLAATGWGGTSTPHARARTHAQPPTDTLLPKGHGTERGRKAGLGSLENTDDLATPTSWSASLPVTAASSPRTAMTGA